MTTNQPSARAAAYNSLLCCEKDGKYTNLEIDSAIKKYGLEGAEKGLYTTLVYGVVERRITLDYIITKLSSKPVSELDAGILTILRLGLYQLVYLDRVPESAAVNESVELAKNVKPRAASFVNAVLRGFLRTMGRNNISYPDKKDREKYLSVRYSCSPDVIKVLELSLPVGKYTEEILLTFEKQPEITLRVNTLKISRDELLARLGGDGIEAAPTAYSPFGIRLSGRTIPAKVMELLRSGYVYIQDEASQLALMAAAPKPGETFFDVCACPGGKSFSAAMIMENTGKVCSFDLHRNKLSLIESGAARLGITIIETAEKNAAVFDEALEKKADIVLCDAPCSGLGVIAKKPELRYKTRDEIKGLPMVQYEILANSSNYVKPGGRLCYTTCTLNRAENLNVAEKFLRLNTDFEAVEFDLNGLKSELGRLTLYPDEHKTDGFFISLFRRRI